MPAQSLLSIHIPNFVRVRMPIQNLEPFLMNGGGNPLRWCIEDVLMTFRR